MKSHKVRVRRNRELCGKTFKVFTLVPLSHQDGMNTGMPLDEMGHGQKKSRPRIERNQSHSEQAISFLWEGPAR